MNDDTAQQPATDTSEAPEKEPIDWKAMARKHEDRAKTLAAQNRELRRKADAYDQQQEAGQSDLEKAITRAEQAEQALAQAQAQVAEKDRMVLAAQVAAEKGVPADRIRGENREEMEADANELLKLIRPAVPAGQAGSPFPPGAGNDAPDSTQTTAEEARAAARRYLGRDKKE